LLFKLFLKRKRNPIFSKNRISGGVKFFYPQKINARLTASAVNFNHTKNICFEQKVFRSLLSKDCILVIDYVSMPTHLNVINLS